MRVYPTSKDFNPFQKNELSTEGRDGQFLNLLVIEDKDGMVLILADDQPKRRLPLAPLKVSSFEVEK